MMIMVTMAGDSAADDDGVDNGYKMNERMNEFIHIVSVHRCFF